MNAYAKSENKKNIESPYKINFRDERAKVIKLSNHNNVDEIEDNLSIESPRQRRNFRVQNKNIFQDISSSNNLKDNFQIENLNRKELNIQNKIMKSESPDRDSITNSYREADKGYNHINADHITKNRSIDSKNYLKKNRNFLNYLKNSNNKLIDLNSHNNDVILPSTSEMIKIPNKDISLDYGDVKNHNIRKIIKIAESTERNNSISNYKANLNKLNDISHEKYVNSNIIHTRINSYSPIPDRNINSNMNMNNNIKNNEIYKRPSSIRLPNINQSNNNNKSRNDTSMNKRPVSMIKTNTHNESLIDDSRINIYRKKSPYYFNDPKLYKLKEERNHNLSINNKLKNLINLSESNVKNYNNSRIIPNTKNSISIDDVDDYEIL